MMTDEERKAHMEKDALVMKRFIRSVVVKIILFLGVVGLGVVLIMYN